MSLHARVVCTCLVGLASLDVAAQALLFEEVTLPAGVSYQGESYGAAWGDFDSDGWPDLWVGNHVADPSLFRNNRDGTFSNIASNVWPRIGGDTHGASWADFDADGDQDLLELVGGLAPNNLFVNEGGFFREMAADYGLAMPGARSRTPVWVDWNRDGQLDLIVTHEIGDSAFPLFLRNDGGVFADASQEVAVPNQTTVAAHVGDLTDDGAPDILLSNGNPSRGPVYDGGVVPLVDLASPSTTSVWPNRIGCSDTVIADFTGDLKNDVFSTCGGGGREVFQRTSNRLEIRITSVSNETAVEFASAGQLRVSVYPSFELNLTTQLRVGSQSMVPQVTQHPERGWRSFTFEVTSQEAMGMPTYVPGVDTGLFVGVSAVSGKWRLALSSARSAGLSVVVEASAPISSVSTQGFLATPAASRPSLVVPVPSGFADQAVTRGLSQGLPCPSAAGGDFDNDGDVDVFLVCSRAINNVPDILLLNDGAGNFSQAPSALGAAGTSLGSGDSVVVADYDRDGFLDIFVTNGAGGAPFNQGPNSLFRNRGNANAWLEVDLEGASANRDAIGAVVTVSAGGRQQVRTLDGGVHRHSQNHKRLHFGLAQAGRIDEMAVRWPDGTVDVYRSFPARQIVALRQGAQGDQDDDGSPDFADNCTVDANPAQLDADMDGFGNWCDADFNGDRAVNFADLAYLRSRFGSGDVIADLDGSGVVNFADLARFRALFGRPPGPSAW